MFKLHKSLIREQYIIINPLVLVLANQYILNLAAKAYQGKHCSLSVSKINIKKTNFCNITFTCNGDFTIKVVSVIINSVS